MSWHIEEVKYRGYALGVGAFSNLSSHLRWSQGELISGMPLSRGIILRKTSNHHDPFVCNGQIPHPNVASSYTEKILLVLQSVL
jgi:hypothetical protein